MKGFFDGHLYTRFVAPDAATGFGIDHLSDLDFLLPSIRNLLMTSRIESNRASQVQVARMNS